jgi:valyl-tRNA synthetase
VSDCAAAVTAALDAYRFDEAANRLYQFVWGTVCDWYLEFTKPILQGDDDAQTETQAMTAWVLSRIVHLLHPIMPFVTEEVWENLAGSEAGLLLTALWPDFPDELTDRAASAEMEWVVQAISALRALRAEMNVSPAARIPLLLKDAEPLAAERIERHREHFMRLARVDEFEPVATVPAGGIQAIVDGATLILRLGDVVDLAGEKARLGKEIGRLDAELAKIAAKLANPGFLSKAKAEVVEAQREREADVARDRDRLKSAYDRLAAT